MPLSFVQFFNDISLGGIAVGIFDVYWCFEKESNELDSPGDDKFMIDYLS